MTFLINGSSYTYGDGLDDPNSAWPVVFGQKLKSSIVNLAQPGGGVDYVVYSTIKEVSLKNYKKVIITWPALHRLMLIRRENNYLLHTGPVHSHFYIGGYLYADTPEFKEYVKLYYKHWSNALYDLKMSLQKIILLQEYLKNRGCQYLFLNTNPYKLSQWLSLSTLEYKDKRRLIDGLDNLDDDQVLAEETEIRSLYSQLDTKYYHDPINFNLFNWSNSQNSWNSVTGHPTPDGHVFIAEYIENLWRNLYDTNEEL